jgi:hypothetical protein
MRRSFPQGTPIEVQVTHGRRRISTGHKHMHSIGPSAKAAQSQRRAKYLLGKLRKQHARYAAAIRAYYNGEGDHP